MSASAISANLTLYFEMVRQVRIHYSQHKDTYWMRSLFFPLSRFFSPEFTHGGRKTTQTSLSACRKMTDYSCKMVESGVAVFILSDHSVQTSVYYYQFRSIPACFPGETCSPAETSATRRQRAKAPGWIRILFFSFIPLFYESSFLLLPALYAL